MLPALYISSPWSFFISAVLLEISLYSTTWYLSLTRHSTPTLEEGAHDIVEVGQHNREERAEQTQTEEGIPPVAHLLGGLRLGNNEGTSFGADALRKADERGVGHLSKEKATAVVRWEKGQRNETRGQQGGAASAPARRVAP